MKLKLTFLLLLVPALVVLGGCGGDDDGGGEVQGGDVSKQEYIAEVDQICEEADQEFDAAVEELGDDPSREEQVQFIEDEAVPQIEDVLGEIRDVEAPQGDVDELTTLYDQLQEEVDELEADPEKFAGTGLDPFEKSGEQFADYGFEECGT